MAILVIHGGAGLIREEVRDDYKLGLQRALKAGYDVLESGGSADEAVMTAVAAMESNDRAFNAGTGGALTQEGTVELDACIMSSDGLAGAVAGVRNTPSAIRLADVVRHSTPHVLLIGEGAERLERNPVANESLITERSRDGLQRWRDRQPNELDPHKFTGSNTVGAVAIDDTGRLAAATSTGGVTGQMPGRVGDAPIPGAGTYANDQIAVSCTGLGEAFLRASTARSLALTLEFTGDLTSSTQRALNEIKTLGGDGGIIAVTKTGNVVWGYNTPHMAYGVATEAGMDFGVHEGGNLFVK